MVYKSRLKILAVLALALFFVSGCNTMEGMGRDVKSAGSSMEDTAHDAKNK